MASATKPKIITAAPSPAARRRPIADAMPAGDEDLRDDRQALDDPVDAREHAGARSRIGIGEFDQAQLLEVEKGAGRGEQRNVQGDPQQVWRVHHQRDAGEGVAAERAVPASRERCGVMAVGTTPARPDRDEHPLAGDGRGKHRRTEEEHALVADPSHGQVGEERPEQRACRAPGGDNREQPLGLAAVEQLDEKAPEHRQQEQVQDADEDVEELSGGNARLLAAERESDEHQRHRDQTVGPRQEDTAPVRVRRPTRTAARWRSRPPRSPSTDQRHGRRRAAYPRCRAPAAPRNTRRGCRRRAERRQRRWAARAARPPPVPPGCGRRATSGFASGSVRARAALQRRHVHRCGDDPHVQR